MYNICMKIIIILISVDLVILGVISPFYCELHRTVCWHNGLILFDICFNKVGLRLGYFTTSIGLFSQWLLRVWLVFINVSLSLHEEESERVETRTRSKTIRISYYFGLFRFAISTEIHVQGVENSDEKRENRAKTALNHCKGWNGTEKYRNERELWNKWASTP